MTTTFRKDVRTEYAKLRAEGLRAIYALQSAKNKAIYESKRMLRWLPHMDDPTDFAYSDGALTARVELKHDECSNAPWDNQDVIGEVRYIGPRGRMSTVSKASHLTPRGNARPLAWHTSLDVAAWSDGSFTVAGDAIAHVHPEMAVFNIASMSIRGAKQYALRKWGVTL